MLTYVASVGHRARPATSERRRPRPEPPAEPRRPTPAPVPGAVHAKLMGSRAARAHVYPESANPRGGLKLPHPHVPESDSTNCNKSNEKSSQARLQKKNSSLSSPPVFSDPALGPMDGRGSGGCATSAHQWTEASPGTSRTGGPQPASAGPWRPGRNTPEPPDPRSPGGVIPHSQAHLIHKFKKTHLICTHFQFQSHTKLHPRFRNSKKMKNVFPNPDSFKDANQAHPRRHGPNSIRTSAGAVPGTATGRRRLGRSQGPEPRLDGAW